MEYGQFIADHTPDGVRLARDFAYSRERLASLFDDLATAFDRTAALAEAHSARTFRPIDEATREIELQRAHQARRNARTARRNAERLRSSPAVPG